MGATRKRLHLEQKGFECVHTQTGELHTVVFRRLIQGELREFSGTGWGERRATAHAALDANMFMYKNQHLFPEVYGLKA